MPKKRSHGDGSLSFLKNRGLWVAVIDDGLAFSGKRRQRFFYSKTRAGAWNKMRAWRYEVAQHGVALDKIWNLDECAFHWLETECKPKLKPAPRNANRSLLKNWVVPQLGSFKLLEIRTLHVQTVYRLMIKRVIFVYRFKNA